MYLGMQAQATASAHVCLRAEPCQPASGHAQATPPTGFLASPGILWPTNHPRPADAAEHPCRTSMSDPKASPLQEPRPGPRAVRRWRRRSRKPGRRGKCGGRSRSSARGSPGGIRACPTSGRAASSSEPAAHKLYRRGPSLSKPALGKSGNKKRPGPQAWPASHAIAAGSLGHCSGSSQWPPQSARSQ
jgi:hypothetical protein